MSKTTPHDKTPTHQDGEIVIEPAKASDSKPGTETSEHDGEKASTAE